ncbi:MAG: hypothetical protein ABEN55_00680, partial [Bradymonadaceae bacterium]
MWRENGDGIPYWRFGGDDYWRSGILRSMTKMVLALVVRQDDTEALKYPLDVSSNNNASLVAIGTDADRGRIRIYTRNDNGTKQATYIPVDPSVWTVVVASIDMTGNGYQYVTARNANGATGSDNTRQDGKVSESRLWVGRRAGQAYI